MPQSPRTCEKALRSAPGMDEMKRIVDSQRHQRAEKFRHFRNSTVQQSSHCWTQPLDIFSCDSKRGGTDEGGRPAASLAERMNGPRARISAEFGSRRIACVQRESGCFGYVWRLCGPASINAPKAAGDRLDEVVVGVAEIVALRTAGPGHQALERNSRRFQPLSPGGQLVGSDRQCQMGRA